MMRFRNLGVLLLACGSVAVADGLPQAQPVMLPQPALSTLPLVDRIVVYKGERRLTLVHGGNIVRSYHVSLGLSPVGQKERSGDFRTPEGSYRLERRNARSDFFLSLKVSYPNEADLKRAHSRHWDTGGSIMIHGFPNQPKHPAAYYQSNDWTDGCIALSNSDMVEVWMRTQDNIPIDIYP